MKEAKKRISALEAASATNKQAAAVFIYEEEPSPELQAEIDAAMKRGGIVIDIGCYIPKSTPDDS